MAVHTHKWWDLDERIKTLEALSTVVPLTTSVSITDRTFWSAALTAPLTLNGLSGFAPVVAGSVVADAIIVPAGTGIIKAGTIGIDSAPEKYLAALNRVMIAGVSVEKAAVTAQVFTAAHAISASKFGVILIQQAATGVYSTKVPLTTQAYVDAPTALAALPAPDAGKIAVGYIAIATGVGAFTANTTNLTNGDGVTTAAFTTLPALVRATTAGVTFATGTNVAATVSASNVGAINDVLVLVYTTDSSGVLTNGTVTFPR